jgi:hypothetical protein
MMELNLVEIPIKIFLSYIINFATIGTTLLELNVAIISFPKLLERYLRD